MKYAVNIVALLALAVVWGRGYLPDPQPQPEPSRIVAAYRESLSRDLFQAALLLESDATVQDVTTSLQDAFDNASKRSYQSIAADVNAIADDDRQGLATLLRYHAEAVQ